jgi:hypothetical protein
MAMRIIKSSGDVYADLGIRKRRNRRHGSSLDDFLREERELESLRPKKSLKVKDELCPLTNEQITRTVQHDRGLALDRLDRNEP